MTRIISIVGQERCDLVYYLSEVCRALKKHTLIIDNSYSKDLFGALRHKKEDDVIERGFAVYTRDVDYSPEAFANFEIIIFYEGYNLCADNLLHSSNVFIVTDYAESSIRQLREAFEKDKRLNDEALKEAQVDFSYILRDKISGKIRDKLAFSLLGMSNCCKLVGAIPFNEVDYNRYIDFSHNKLQTVKGVSEGMREALIFILMELEQLDRKSALRVINNA